MAGVRGFEPPNDDLADRPSATGERTHTLRASDENLLDISVSLPKHHLEVGGGILPNRKVRGYYSCCFTFSGLNQLGAPTRHKALRVVRQQLPTSLAANRADVTQPRTAPTTNQSGIGRIANDPIQTRPATAGA
jgi:hypothetical protein